MRQLFAKANLEARWKHHDAILPALSMTNDDRLVRKVDVLDPQLQSLVDAHAGSVVQSSEKPLLFLKPSHVDVTSSRVRTTGRRV
jgi:hypothetical protein